MSVGCLCVSGLYLVVNVFDLCACVCVCVCVCVFALVWPTDGDLYCKVACPIIEKKRQQGLRKGGEGW